MAVASGRGVRPKRPLSPHLQIYSMSVSMTMSIVHRITGAALYFGALLLAWWLVAAAMGPDAYNYFLSWCNTWLGRIVLLGYTWALMHHMMGGIRHFIWDSGYGYDLKTVDLMSWGSLAASLFLTAVVWISVAMGGF